MDTEHIGATYTVGVLKLELIKKPEAQPKRIKVNVGGGQKLEEPELPTGRWTEVGSRKPIAQTITRCFEVQVKIAPKSRR